MSGAREDCVARVPSRGLRFYILSLLRRLRPTRGGSSLCTRVYALRSSRSHLRL
jgi:hypothetical protein